MAKDKDILAQLPKAERIDVIKKLTYAFLGDEVGATAWPSMEASLTYDKRQPGDDPDPEKNFWGGAWRIYEAD